MVKTAPLAALVAVGTLNAACLDLSSKTSCVSQQDCLNGRLCVDMVCRDAPEVCRADEQCPDGFNCFRGDSFGYCSPACTRAQQCPDRIQCPIFQTVPDSPSCVELGAHDGQGVCDLFLYGFDSQTCKDGASFVIETSPPANGEYGDVTRPIAVQFQPPLPFAVARDLTFELRGPTGELAPVTVEREDSLATCIECPAAGMRFFPQDPLPDGTHTLFLDDEDNDPTQGLQGPYTLTFSMRRRVRNVVQLNEGPATAHPQVAAQGDIAVVAWEEGEEVRTANLEDGEFEPGVTVGTRASLSGAPVAVALYADSSAYFAAVAWADTSGVYAAESFLKYSPRVSDQSTTRLSTADDTTHVDLASESEREAFAVWGNETSSGSALLRRSELTEVQGEIGIREPVLRRNEDFTWTAFGWGIGPEPTSRACLSRASWNLASWEWTPSTCLSGLDSDARNTLAIGSSGGAIVTQIDAATGALSVYRWDDEIWRPAVRMDSRDIAVRAAHAVMSGPQQATVVWIEDDGAVFARSSDENGFFAPSTMLAPGADASSPYELFAPRVLTNAKGEAWVVWQTTFDEPFEASVRETLWSRVYTPVGGWQEPFEIATLDWIPGTEDMQSVDLSPRLALSDNGSGIVAWMQPTCEGSNTPCAMAGRLF